jgi:hypothetical protein
MAKIKYTIEIDDQVVDTLKKQFQSISEKLSPNLTPKTFENFLEQIIESYIKTSEQMKDLGTKFGDIFNKIGDLGDLDLEKFFGNFGEKKEEDKVKKPNETNLKN